MSKLIVVLLVASFLLSGCAIETENNIFSDLSTKKINCDLVKVSGCGGMKIDYYESCAEYSPPFSMYSGNCNYLNKDLNVWVSEQDSLEIIDSYEKEVEVSFKGATFEKVLDLKEVQVE